MVTGSDQINILTWSNQLFHSHGEGFVVLICEPGHHLKVTLTDVVRPAGLLDVNLNGEKNKNQIVLQKIFLLKQPDLTRVLMSWDVGLRMGKRLRSWTTLLLLGSFSFRETFRENTRGSTTFWMVLCRTQINRTFYLVYQNMGHVFQLIKRKTQQMWK